MSNLFEDFEDSLHTESIYECEEDYDAGLQEAEILYCPAMHINPFTIPSLFSSIDAGGRIADDITCKYGRSFLKLKAHVEQNELSFDGSKTNLTLYILGVKANRIGLIRKLLALPGVYIVKDMNNRSFVIGNHISPAFAKTTLSTGKTIEDLSGAQIQLTSNMIFFEYKGVTPEVNNKSDFTDEHTNEYQ